MTQSPKSVIVIKCGGSILTNPAELSSLLAEIKKLHAAGLPLVIVHGGGPDINQLCSALGVTSHFCDGLRVTTPEVLNVTQMALLGKTNNNLCYQLNLAAIPALGLSGHDVKLLQAKPLDYERLGLVGAIEQVNRNFINQLLKLNVVPVIAPLAVDDLGNCYNVNADMVAAEVAAALNAQHLILLSDINGYYTNYPDPNSLQTQLTTSTIANLLASGQVNGGMQPKLQAALTGLNQGVTQAYIVNGAIAGIIDKCLQANLDVGTTILKG